ncbi:MAG: hypothetical protein QXP20_07185 [Candidatus Bathyarchaeia archaeon]
MKLANIAFKDRFPALWSIREVTLHVFSGQTILSLDSPHPFCSVKVGKGGF